MKLKVLIMATTVILLFGCNNGSKSSAVNSIPVDSTQSALSGEEPKEKSNDTRAKQTTFLKRIIDLKESKTDSMLLSDFIEKKMRIFLSKVLKLMPPIKVIILI